MTRYQRISQRLPLPSVVVRRAALEAAFSAAGARAKAQEELSRPKPLRRSLAAIHREVLDAERLARVLSGV